MQKGKRKPITFDQLAGKATKKTKSSMFYDMLLLAKQDKINVKQKMPFAVIEISTI
jgi:chromatin segregation and condensation protein Rec8/ScpA/Scc1 (kleisin family)